MYQQGDSQRAIGQNLGTSQHCVQSVLQKIKGNWTTGGQKKRQPSKKPSATDEHYKKVVYLDKLRKKKSSNDLTQDLRDVSGPSFDPATVY